MKAIIFGITGQDGHYLNEICLEKNIEVIGISRAADHWVKGNVADRNFVDSLIRQHAPQYIFHLAANSTTKHEALFENHETISTGTLNILESVKKNCPACKVFITGSGIQFVNKGLPIRETDEFEATNPYAVSRIHSVYAARYYRTLGLKVYVGYLFHHESPFRKMSHVSKFTTEAIKKIAKNGYGNLQINNMDVKKEWGYARDISEGIFTLVSQSEIFEATIGTGIAYSIKDWIELCFEKIGKDWRDFVISDSPDFTPEYKLLISNPATMNGLGWHAKTEFKTLCDIMFKY
jgi:GDPmannose 4,6-dehydratase